MGLFDSFAKQVGSALKNEASKAVSGAVRSAAQSVGKGTNKSESFTFASLPTSVEELSALPEATLDSPFKTAALTVAALCSYERDPEATYAMLNVLKGPEPLSNYEKQFIKERLTGKYYKSFAFFAGATPQNNYVPTQPYTITVSTTPYSFDNENWATLYVKSGGADNPAPIKLRKKPSTGQWFLNDVQCLSDIRLPAADDKWA